MLDRPKQRSWSLSLGAVVMAILAGCSSPPGGTPKAEKAKTPPVEEVTSIAEEGFIYGLPIVMNYAAMYGFAVDRDSGQFKAPFNEIANEARVFTPKDTSVPAPNSDTPYSILFMDLRSEPMVISVPAIPKTRYYSVQLCDGNTFNYGYIGTRSTGPEAGDFLVAGPAWNGERPPGVRDVFRSSTQFSLAVFRTQLLDAADMDNVKKVQAGFMVQPLSTYSKQAPPPAAPAISFPKIDKDLAKTNFFEFLDFALQFAPPGPEEEAIRAKLARIGVGPGKTLAFQDLPADLKGAVGLGMKEGGRKVEEATTRLGAKVNGWIIGSPFGDRAFFHGDWLKRAAAAKVGIYGNDAVEATYPMATVDDGGEPLDGSKHAYTLTFVPGQLPPVNAFWSITMYDGRTKLLIENPINRYLVNSPMLPSLQTGKDGSVTLYIQKDSPGKARASNWLPAPDGPISLIMRLYWPRTDAPSVLPPGEGTWQPPTIKRSAPTAARRTTK
jgi:hypothetical protein